MWFFLQSLGLSGEGGSRVRATPSHPNVLTPDSIPDFCIPPRRAAVPARRIGTRLSPLQAARRHIIQVESVGPSLGQGEEEEGEGQDEEEGPTLGAGLVPLHANPSEIIYLPESPHTRRKESLFHNSEAWPWGLLDTQEANSSPWASLEPQRPNLCPQGSSPNTWISLGPQGPSLCPQGPNSYPCSSLGLQGPYSGSWAYPNATQRPRALDSDTASSADSSPLGSPSPPRAREPSWAPRRLGPPLGFPAQERTLTLDQGGTLSLEAEYSPEGSRLHLRLLAAHGLYPPPFPARDVGCCVSLCLLPGKCQRQRSAVIRRSREPVFNEDFFFEGLPQDELSQRHLKIKVLNRGSGVRRDCVVGRYRLELSALLPAAHALSRG
ncbi:C2 calcium-dependent domain-containing protein 4C-like [Hemitrygon akajei]|uniref:C2 calcium-dependent domain-containing protein 4C-like n=1 Tax=Hemitrygon akajei TaxID=2704970 RepID=UPI003BF9DDAD